jgi:protein-S-isoprenylcysteine O-methyltransferase Ste14
MLLHPLPSRATVAAAVVLLAAFFAAFYFADPSALSLALGLALMALGLAIRLLTNATLKKNQASCREGCYAVCRHPMYVGSVALAAGIAVVLNHPLGLALVAAAVAISLYRIRREEAFLMASLADYAQYRREVPAFPTPGSVFRALRSGELRQRLSLRQCFLNGEILRLNLYLPLLLAAGLYLHRLGKLPLPAAALVAGALASLAVSAASIHWHPVESQRSRADYLLPGILASGVLALLLWQGAPA